MKNISKLFIAFTILSVIILSSCQRNDDKLYIGVLPDIDSVPIAAAELSARLDDNIKTVKFKSGAERDAALVSGKIDGAVSDVISLLLQKDGGADLKALFATSGSYSLLCSEKSGITDENSIKNTGVAISHGTIIEYTFKKFGKGTPVSVPSLATRKQLLDSGTIDAAILPEPFASDSVAKGATRIFSEENNGLGIVAVLGKSLNEKKYLTDKLTDGYNEGVKLLLENDEIESKAFEFLGLPYAGEKFCYCIASDIREDTVESVNSFLLEKGEIGSTILLKDIIANE